MEHSCSARTETSTEAISAHDGGLQIQNRRAHMNVQQSWRYCQKCEALFYAGHPDQGVCAAGGAHSAEGFDFALPYNGPATANAQESWRYCQKCQVMFYAGRPDQGVCAAGGAHSAHGDDFVLPHSVPATSDAQDAWRYCQKCEAMFYARRPDQGTCPAGGAHSAEGFDSFVLFHGTPTITSFSPLYNLTDPSNTTLGVLGTGFCPGGSVEFILQAMTDNSELTEGSPVLATADSNGNIDAAALLLSSGWGYPGLATVAPFQVGAFYEITQTPTAPAIAAAHATWTGDGISGFAQGGF
jgi:hypothetical protein